MKASDFQQLNIVHTDYNKVWTYCPFHRDIKRPNLSISLSDKYYGKWRCWACGRNGCLSKEQMEKLNIPNISKKKKRNKPININWVNLTLFYYNNYRPAIEGVIVAGLWNVRGDSLSAFNIGWDNEAYTFPMYNSTLEVTGIQRAWVSGKKKAVHGSQLGLFVPITINTKMLFITEGISDAIAVYDIGFDVIGKPCATFGDNIIKDFVCNKLISKIIIVPDNNDAGKKSCNNIVKNIKGIVNYNIFQFDEAKDIRDYIAKVGKQQVKQELEKYI